MSIETGNGDWRQQNTDLCAKLPLTNCMDENALAKTGTATPRQQLAEQVTKLGDANNADNSLISQLTSNPFFTAVSHLTTPQKEAAIDKDRDLAWLLLPQQQE
jgi:hypothetical protein